MIKGYVQNPHIALPPKKDGHIDVAKAVGEGWLEVTKDQGLKQPYTGQVPIVSGEIAEDFTYYLAKSEQIPSAVGLSVLLSLIIALELLEVLYYRLYQVLVMNN